MILQEKCNEILNDDSVLDEVKVDMIQEIVLEHYGCTKKESEEIIMDILWRHKDPNYKRNKGYAKIIKVEPVLQKVNIPDLKTRKEYSEQLKKQFPEKIVKPAFKEFENTAQHNTEKENEEQIAQRKKKNFETLRSYFNTDTTDDKIQELLESNNYDIAKIISNMSNEISGSFTPSLPDQSSESKSYLYEDTKTSVSSVSPEVKHAKLCSFFQKGNCFRSDCMFSHDVNTKICSYWLKGDCLAGANCLFLHEAEISKLSIKETTPINTPKSSKAQLYNSSPKSSTSPGKSTKFKFHPNKTFIPSSVFNDSRRLSIIPTPKFAPWEPSDDPHLKKYLASRKNAIKLEEKKVKNSKLSTSAYSQNNPVLARDYSKKVQEILTKIEDAMAKADNELSLYNKESKGDYFIELTGMSLEDAKYQIEDIIPDFKKNNPNGQKAMYMIVPSSNHPGYKKLTKPLCIWLHEKGYKNDFFGCGSTVYGSVIGFDPWSLQ